MKKKLTANMIALVMSVSLPMTTYAANWYLEDGSVTVNADNSGQTVTQGSGSAVPDEGSCDYAAGELCRDRQHNHDQCG